MKTCRLFLSLLISLSLVSSFAKAETPPVKVDKFGIIEKVPAQPSPHWLWVYDTNFISFSDGRAHLIDGDTGRYFGSLNTGYVHSNTFNLPSHYREIYSAETYYSRHVGGTRTDLVRIYDPIDLSLLHEIKIPNKRATTIPRPTNTAISDNDQFMAIFNLTPATSISVVDVKNRKFIGEVEIPGCALSISAGGSRFFSICGNGTAYSYTLDDAGNVSHKKQSKPFFDVDKDPIMEAGVRYGDKWLFPSVEGMLYSIDVSGAELSFPSPWPLIEEADRKDGWRTGGIQQIAVNEPHARLYSIMHQGPADTYEHAGPEIWVYDLKTKKRIQRIVTKRIAISIHVSPDEQPLLFSLPDTEATLDIYDALTGKHLRTINEMGVTPIMMATPPYK